MQRVHTLAQTQNQKPKNKSAVIVEKHPCKPLYTHTCTNRNTLVKPSELHRRPNEHKQHNEFTPLEQKTHKTEKQKCRNC